MSYPSVAFGPITYEHSDSFQIPTLHFLAVGSTGSGKTTIMKQLMVSALRKEAWRDNCRALVYDAKQDLVPFLYSLGLEERVVLANPVDKRSRAWKMSQDVCSPMGARQVATLLVPEVGVPTGSSEFFDQACREVLAGVMLGLNSSTREGGYWTLRDVIEGTLNPDLRKALLSVDKAPNGETFKSLQRIRESYMSAHDELRSNIEASLRAKISIYEPVAALWDKAESNGFFSIEDWAHQAGQILVIGNDETARATIDSLNKVLFKRIAECLLSKPAVKPTQLMEGVGRSWIFLDEIREAGELDGLRSLMNKGRSKGACIAMSMQDIEGLRAVYGREEANEIAGQCATVGVLRVSNPDTAEWASNLFGQSIQEVASESMSIGGGTQIGTSTSSDLRPRVPTSMFLDLPPANPSTGIVGFFRAPGMESKVGQLAFLPQTTSWSRATQGVPGPDEADINAEVIPFEPHCQYMRCHSNQELASRFPTLHIPRQGGEGDEEDSGAELKSLLDEYNS